MEMRISAIPSYYGWKVINSVVKFSGKGMTRIQVFPWGHAESTDEKSASITVFPNMD